MVNIIIGAVIGFVVCAFVYKNNSAQATKIMTNLNEKIDELEKKLNDKINSIKK